MVNKDSNLLCSPGTGRGQEAISKQADISNKAATAKQMAQGQRTDETAVGAGFVIGASGCFKAEDKIRAEVTDEGTVTMIRYLPMEQPASPAGARSFGESAGTGLLAMPSAELGVSIQEKPGQLDMTTLEGYPPKEYAIQAIPAGRLEAATDHKWLNAPVKSHDGQTIGRIENLIQDSDKGRIEYVEVSLAGERGTSVVPWAYFRPVPKQHMVVLDARQYQLMPSYTSKDVKELAPSVESLKSVVLTATAPADLQPLADRNAAREEAHKVARPARKELPEGELIRGTVVSGSKELFRQTQVLPMVVEDEISGKEIPLSVPSNALSGHVRSTDDTFQPGDEIEIYMTPTGDVEFIDLLREHSWTQDADG